MTEMWIISLFDCVSLCFLVRCAREFSRPAERPQWNHQDLQRPARGECQQTSFICKGNCFTAFDLACSQDLIIVSSLPFRFWWKCYWRSCALNSAQKWTTCEAARSESHHGPHSSRPNTNCQASRGTLPLRLKGWDRDQPRGSELGHILTLVFKRCCVKMLEQRPTKRSQTLTLVAVQMAVVLSGRGRGWEWGHRVLLETGSRLIRRLIVAQSLNKLYFWDIVAMSAFCFLYFNSTETWSLYHSKLNLLFLCKSWQSIGYIPGLKKEKKKKVNGLIVWFSVWRAENQ